MPDFLVLPNPEDSILMRHLWYLSTLLERHWKREYLTELRESHKIHQKGATSTVSVGDFVVVYDDTPRGMWRMGLIDKVIRGKDEQIRGAVVS